MWWALEVASLSAEAIDLIFPSGQVGDVVLLREGTEVYRWSEDRAFPQIVRMSTLEPERSIGIVLNDSLELAPGLYDVTATVTASVGPQGSAKPLPEIKTTITVR